MLLTAWIGVTINGQPLTTVSDIHISNDTTTLGTQAEIEVPINAILGYKQADFAQPLRTQIATGDRVVITAGYDEYPNQSETLFDGYVYDFFEGVPSIIRCNESYWFTMGNYNKSWPVTTFRAVIKDVLSFVNGVIDTDNTATKRNNPHVEAWPQTITDIDFNLENISFGNMAPAAVLDYFTSQVPGIVITLINGQLYANLASNFTDTVKLDTRYNIVETNLQRPATTFKSFKLKVWQMNADGTKSSYETGDPNGQLREMTIFKIPIGDSVENIAKNAILRFKQNHYSGKVKTKLYPTTDLFWRVEYHDESYPDKSGVYTITAQDISINTTSGINKNLTLAYLLTP
jgi:hypothetical protein